MTAAVLGRRNRGMFMRLGYPRQASFLEHMGNAQDPRAVVGVFYSSKEQRSASITVPCLIAR